MADHALTMPNMSDQPTDNPAIDQFTPEEQLEKQVVKDNPHHVIISDVENKKARWYVVHTYSGHENKVAETLKQRAETLNLTDKIIEVLIPTQEKIEIKRGQKKAIDEKIFPGYMLVHAQLNDDTWLAIRTTQGVTGFVGVGPKPKPLPRHEVEAIKQYMTQAAPQYKADFVEGEVVKIVDGPFTDMMGTVSQIDEIKSKVEVLVSIFGRETPMELDLLQVQKA